MVLSLFLGNGDETFRAMTWKQATGPKHVQVNRACEKWRKEKHGILCREVWSYVELRIDLVRDGWEWRSFCKFLAVFWIGGRTVFCQLLIAKGIKDSSLKANSVYHRGFQRNRWTTEQIFCIRQILKKEWVYTERAHHIFKTELFADFRGERIIFNMKLNWRF